MSIKEVRSSTNIKEGPEAKVLFTDQQIEKTKTAYRQSVKTGSKIMAEGTKTAVVEGIKAFVPASTAAVEACFKPSIEGAIDKSYEASAEKSTAVGEKSIDMTAKSSNSWYAWLWSFWSSK